MLMTIWGGQARKRLEVTVGTFEKEGVATANAPPASADLQGEHEVAADALLSDDVLHGPKCGA